MTSPWDLSEVLDEEQEGDTDLVEFDVPASRSYNWEKRAIEIKEQGKELGTDRRMSASIRDISDRSRLSTPRESSFVPSKPC